MLITLEPESVNVSDKTQRTIFIGDVHGSFDPLLYV